MRKIKFRGIAIKELICKMAYIKTGDYVTGSLIVADSEPARCEIMFLKGTYPFLIQVDSNSVSQFVGYDSAGNEVYEGDVLIDELENETVVEIYDRPEKIARLVLKKNGKE